MFQNLEKSMKGVLRKLKFTTGFPAHITNGETLHDVFTILLIVTAIIIAIVL